MYAVRAEDLTTGDMPFTVEDVKKHLRILSTVTEEDDLLAKYILSAFSEAEIGTKRRLSLQEWKLYPDSGTTQIILADFSPVSKVEGPYDSSDHLVSGFVLTTNFTEPETVSVSPAFGDSGYYLKITCGYESPESIPEPILQWMRMRVGTYYEHRETDADKAAVHNPFADALLKQHKVWRF